MDKPHLYYFSRAEFVRADQYGNPAQWWDQMSPRLLVLLDLLRYRHGGPILISAHDYALGRELGPDDHSQHNIDKWGEVRAADVMFPRIKVQADAEHLVLIAKQCGFTGIGIGPEWIPHFGAHLDVRHEREPGRPATWGYVRGKKGKQITVSLEDALEAMP
jgi:hypothetical protein